MNEFFAVHTTNFNPCPRLERYIKYEEKIVGKFPIWSFSKYIFAEMIGGPKNRKILFAFFDEIGYNQKARLPSWRVHYCCGKLENINIIWSQTFQNGGQSSPIQSIFYVWATPGSSLLYDR